MDITGYHGTSKTSAEKILATSHFNKSVEDYEWAGHGIYFFIDGYTKSSAKQNASKYAIGIKHITDVAVLEAIIKIDSSRIFDLTNSDRQAEFIACFELLWKDAFRRFGDVGSEKVRKYRPHVLECSAINRICVGFNYQAVIKSDYFNFDQTRNRSHPYATIPNCTMFCLRCEECINELHFLETGD